MGKRRVGWLVVACLVASVGACAQIIGLEPSDTGAGGGGAATTRSATTSSSSSTGSGGSGAATTGSTTSSSTGTGQRAQGAPCSADDECLSGVCANGVCCDMACNGKCQACTQELKGSGMDGACGDVAAGTDPLGQCTDLGADACSTDGACDGHGACRLYAAGTPCGSPSCAPATGATQPMCDGAGHCDTTPQSCSPYRGCNGNACASTCAQDSDCVGPCHVCPSGAAQLCLAPLAPVASLTAAGVACKKPLTACAPATPPTCGPAGTYGVGVEPVGIAFDGTNMWVANFMDGTVSVLSPSGMQIAGSPFQVGNGPYGIAFDGANMWITNFFDDSVSVLSAATGAQIAGSPFPVGTNPEGIAFDGANMWIVDNGGNDVTELSVATGANVGSSPYATVSGPSAIAFDGKNMWVTNAGTGTIVELNATGTPVGNSNASVGTEPFSIALDGSGHVWIADYGSDNVTKVPLVGGTPPFPSFPLPAGSAPHGIAFDGTNLWTADYGPASDHGHTVSQIAPDGTVLGTFNVGHAPNFIAFDGTHVWVTNSDDNTVTAL